MIIYIHVNARFCILEFLDWSFSPPKLWGLHQKTSEDTWSTVKLCKNPLETWMNKDFEVDGEQKPTVKHSPEGGCLGQFPSESQFILAKGKEWWTKTILWNIYPWFKWVFNEFRLCVPYSVNFKFDRCCASVAEWCWILFVLWLVYSRQADG